MQTKTIAGALGLLAAATLLMIGGAHAGASRSDGHRGDARAGAVPDSARSGLHRGGTRWTAGRSSAPGTYDPGYWSAAAAAEVAAKAAARAAYDAHDSDYLHRCYQPQRIWTGAYDTWRLVSVC
jgi:hypothetical protein